MSELGVTAFAVAFTGGVLSFLSPCVLALVPGYLAFISGAKDNRWRTTTCIQHGGYHES